MSAVPRKRRNVSLVGEEVRLFAELGQRLVNELDSWLAGSAAPMPLTAIPVRTDEATSEISGSKTVVTTSRIGELGLTPLGLRVALRKWP
jgi:hypothetical protein